MKTGERVAGLQLHEHGADFRAGVGIVTAHALDAFERNPDHAIRRRVGRLEHADHDVGFRVLFLFVENQPVEWMKLVADRERHGEFHVGITLDVLKILPRNIARRGFQMKNGIEHELQFGTACAQHRVKTAVDAGERRLRLRLDHPNREQQSTGERDGGRGHGGGKRALAQAAKNDAENIHAVTSAATA